MKPKPWKIILGVLAFLPVCAFWFRISRFVVNIPLWDDYGALDFLSAFFDSGLNEKVRLIFAQCNEHRIAFARIVALANCCLTGRIDFRTLVFIGNISLLGLAALLFMSFKPAQENKRFLYFMPALFLLFQPLYCEAILWALCSLSHIWVLFFVYLAIYLLRKKDGKYFFSSLSSAVLATFTNGNGMLVFPLGLIALLYQKRHREAVLWTLTGIMCIVLYFHGYVKPSHHPSIVDALLADPSRTIIHFFCLAGSFLFPFVFHYRGVHIILLPPLWGASCLAYFLCLLSARYYKRNMAITLFFAFLLLTAWTIALGRSGFGIKWAYFSRYMLLSTLLLVVTYLSAAETLSQKALMRIFPLLLVVAIFFNVASYRASYALSARYRQDLIRDLANWKEGSFEFSYPYGATANSIMSRAISKNIYVPPNYSSRD